MYALEGIRIADFGWVWAGSYCTKLLADMGAQVIKFETKKRPDVSRKTGIFPNNIPGHSLNRSGYHHKLNRNKLSVTLDLTKPKAVELAKEIIKISDVVSENYSPRVMKRMGLDYEAVKEIKPNIIYLSMPGFGDSGPLKEYLSYGPLQEALSGLTHFTGYQGGLPIKYPMSYTDPTAGLTGASAILAALYWRYKTGEGQYINVSQWEATVVLMGASLMEWIMNGRIGERLGNRSPYMAPHGCYKCKGEDKWITIVVASEKEWKSFCRALGDPKWTREEKFSDMYSRLNHQDELDSYMEEWTINYTPEEVMEILQMQKVASAPSFNTKELVNNPHLKERDFFAEIDHHEVGKRLIPGVSFKLSKSPGDVRSPAPDIGEHNQYVFGKLLGMPQEEINRLIEEEIIY